MASPAIVEAEPGRLVPSLAVNTDRDGGASGGEGELRRPGWWGSGRGDSGGDELAETPAGEAERSSTETDSVRGALSYIRGLGCKVKARSWDSRLLRDPLATPKLCVGAGRPPKRWVTPAQPHVPRIPCCLRARIPGARAPPAHRALGARNAEAPWGHRGGAGTDGGLVTRTRIPQRPISLLPSPAPLARGASQRSPPPISRREGRAAWGSGRTAGQRRLPGSPCASPPPGCTWGCRGRRSLSGTCRQVTRPRPSWVWASVCAPERLFSQVLSRFSPERLVVISISLRCQARQRPHDCPLTRRQHPSPPPERRAHPKVPGSLARR